MVDDVRIVPANEASCQDLATVFGNRGTPARCQCQWFKIRNVDWQLKPARTRARRLREQTGCGNPGALNTSGLVAYLDGEPVGWCAVEPRTAYRRLLAAKVPWAGRDEDPTDDRVWAVTCFVTRTGYRRRGVSRALAAAVPEFARTRGARAVEGYPMADGSGQRNTWGELYVGAESMFAEAGFTVVSRPTPRRVVMRLELVG